MNKTEPTKKEMAEFRRAVNQRNENIKGGGFYRALDFFIMLLAVFVLAIALRVAVFEPVRVKGPSMLSTLQDKDFMVVEKLSYAFSSPKRGDILILYYPEVIDHTCVKRVIGLPGDEVRIEGGKVFVNGNLLDEPYLDPNRTPDGRHDGVAIVKEGCVFVLGDNRNNSLDSSSLGVGSIGMERIVGKVAAVLYPFSQARLFPRPTYSNL